MCCNLEIGGGIGQGGDNVHRLESKSLFVHKIKIINKNQSNIRFYNRRIAKLGKGVKQP